MTSPGTILPIRLDAVSYAPKGLLLIDRVSLSFGAARRTVILGPNGAGKSLLMRLGHGLIAPTQGRILYAGGRDGADRATRRRQAMVFQRPVLLRRSAQANVEFALAAAGIGPAGARRRQAEEALARFGLDALARRPARLLSGGEQQRLALARAWAGTPEILFLDEPTAHLDPAASFAVETAIAKFAAAGIAIVMSTHDLGQARRIAGDIVFLHKGCLLENQPAECFFAAPSSLEAQAFLSGALTW